MAGLTDLHERSLVYPFKKRERPLVYFLRRYIIDQRERESVSLYRPRCLRAVSVYRGVGHDLMIVSSFSVHEPGRQGEQEQPAERRAGERRGGPALQFTEMD
jgi:hypothetical protein